MWSWVNQTPPIVSPVSDPLYVYVLYDYALGDREWIGVYASLHDAQLAGITRFDAGGENDRIAYSTTTSRVWAHNGVPDSASATVFDLFYYGWDPMLPVPAKPGFNTIPPGQTSRFYAGLSIERKARGNG